MKWNEIIFKKRHSIYTKRNTRISYNCYSKNHTANRSLKGRNIIITGGGRGLGYYIAKKSLAEGARVLITGRNENT